VAVGVTTIGFNEYPVNVLDGPYDDGCVRTPVFDHTPGAVNRGRTEFPSAPS